MAVKDTPFYTLTQAATLTGLHKNTLRMKIRAGQIPAEAREGKFGIEYRISRRALIDVGLLDDDSREAPAEPAEVLARVEADAPGEGSLHDAMRDLFVRHENAMFRMGYMEAELERSRALAENAASLQEEQRRHETEIAELRRALETAQARAREIDELRVLLRDMERETQRLRAEVESYREAEERRRRWQFWRR